MNAALQIPTRPISRKPFSFPADQKMSDTDRIGLALSSPDLFAQIFLQTDLWDKQAEILRAVAVKPRVAVKACHSSSKTHSMALAVLWFLARYDDAVCITTAPTGAQVEKLLWGEIHSALRRSLYPFPKANLTELRIHSKRYAYGLSTSVTNQDEGAKFQGFHAANVLVVMDEAPGVDQKIWEAIEGARAGGNVRVVAIGNPTISSGPFHTAFTNQRSGWTCFTIGAFDTPNLRGLTLDRLVSPDFPDADLDVNVRPYLTNRRWVKDHYFEWGPGHPLWESRVLGEFPTQSEDALLSLAWLEASTKRELPGTGKLRAGLDVAGPGDNETVLTIRRGVEVVFHRGWAQTDPRGEVVAVLNQYRDDLEAVNVDSIGIGWNMYQHLLDMKFPAYPINVQERSNDPEKYHDLKAEYYWGLRQRFQAGDISGKLLDDTSVGQLAGLRYFHNSRGQIELENKEKAEKRGVSSPDRAESLMLAFAENSPVYGFLQVAKELQQKAADMVERGFLSKPIKTEQQLSCPKCKTPATRCQGGWRCQACGEQFWGPGDRKPANPNVKRGDILAKSR